MAAWQQTDAKSQVTTYSFDELERMTRRLEPDLDSRWDYDTATKGVGKLARAYTWAVSGSSPAFFPTIRLGRTMTLITRYEKGDDGRYEDGAQAAPAERAGLAGVDESLRRRVDDDRRILFA